MKNLVRIVIVLLFTPALFAQNSITAHGQYLHKGLQLIILRSAEQMPEEKYGFKPTEGVRSFGQIVGHVADSGYVFCSMALGEKNPRPQVEKNKTTKAELIAALKESFAYCDKAYAMDEAKAAEMIKLMGKDAPRFGALHVNNVHGSEHYGNLVTYLRMNGLVPPTSDQAFMRDMLAK